MKKIFQLFVFCLFGISAWANGNVNPMSPVDTICNVSIGLDSTNTGLALTAYSTGTGPFVYIWSTGETTASIDLVWGINYCVTVTDATGCEASSCLYNQNSCTAQILTTPTGSMTAIPGGVSPFTFAWSNGSTNAYIFPNAPGNYCVTITDVTGCQATTCAYYNPNPCDASIVQLDSEGYEILQAFPVSGVTYTWSTGETTNYIVPSSSGNYCVTVTGGGCTSSACYYYNGPNFTISGYLYFPDSINNPGPMEGTVELFFNDLNTNTWESIATTSIQSNANGWSNFYDFGVQSVAGDYIVKATLDPNFPGAAGYMPTYHFSTVHWDEADVISLPSSGSGLYQIILNDGSNLSGGSGNINGTVTEGDGFTANDENDRSGDPRPNTSVLLFDSNEQPITHTLTDAVGNYSFGNLPMGTYKLEVEIVGQEQAVRWVTLSDNNPASNGNDFEVTPDGIVLGISDLVAESNVHVSPNPTTGVVNFGFEAKANFDAKISVASVDGQTLLTANQSIVKGKQSLQLDLTSLPTGLYFLQVTTGNEVISRKIIKQ